MKEKTTAPTKVFISYSWDSEEHKEQVLSLANTLRNPWGIETDIDQYVRGKPPFTPPQGWDLWMEKRIEWAEFVLIVCTETYKRRFRGDEEPGLGRGVTWEGTIIRQRLYNDQLVNTKFIPVVFSSQDSTHVPTILNGNDKYVIKDERSFRDLCYRLRREPTLVIPEVSTAQLPSPPVPIFFTSPDLETEPPPVLLNVAETLSRVSLRDIQDGDSDCSPYVIQLCEEAYPNELIHLIHWTIEEEEQLIALFRECRRGWYFQLILSKNEEKARNRVYKVCPLFLPLLEPDEHLWEQLTRSASLDDWYALDEIIQSGLDFSGSEIRLVGQYSIGESVADDAMEQFGIYVPDKNLLPAFLFVNKRLGLLLISYLKHPDGFAKECMLCDDNINECQVFGSLQEAQQNLKKKLQR